jgi:hypothetical protein
MMCLLTFVIFPKPSLTRVATGGAARFPIHEVDLVEGR